MEIDLGKESPHQTIINISYVLDSSLARSQSFPTTPISEKQQTLQFSTSTNVIGEMEETIFDTFIKIKIKNEMLKKSTYAQFWKKSSTSQGRLLLAFNSEKGKMHMAFLEAQTVEPKTLTDYKQTSFEFDARNVHPIDQLEMHKQTGEMISSTLTSTSMSLFKMQVALSNAQS